MVSKKNQAVLQKFGAHLEKLRRERGLSLRELSYACSIDNSKISKIEKGLINITMITILDLAYGLEISPTDLLNFHKAAVK